MAHTIEFSPNDDCHLCYQLGQSMLGELKVHPELLEVMFFDVVCHAIISFNVSPYTPRGFRKLSCVSMTVRQD